jgi:two-component system KDP operon response regulator KdpE
MSAVQPHYESHADMRARVLLIEDDTAVRSMLNAAFRQSNFEMIEAVSGEQGLRRAVEDRPDLVVLDIGLPDMSGIELLKTMREWSREPILVLSATSQEKVKVECLEAGADDYITKPFFVSELMARLRVAHRRQISMASPSQEPVFESGPLRIDFAARRVSVNGEAIHLTPLEYKLLSVLAQHTGKIVTHRQLLNDVWGPEYTDEWQYLRLYVGYLRKKLPGGMELILNEPGVGYRLALD